MGLRPGELAGESGLLGALGPAFAGEFGTVGAFGALGVFGETGDLQNEKTGGSLSNW